MKTDKSLNQQENKFEELIQKTELICPISSLLNASKVAMGSSAAFHQLDDGLAYPFVKIIPTQYSC